MMIFPLGHSSFDASYLHSFYGRMSGLHRAFLNKKPLRFIFSSYRHANDEVRLSAAGTRILDQAKRLEAIDNQHATTKSVSVKE